MRYLGHGRLHAISPTVLPWPSSPPPPVGEYCLARAGALWPGQGRFPPQPLPARDPLMSWLRIDDGMVDHPKIVEAGPDSIAAQLRALSWCSRLLTNGVFSRKVAERITHDLAPNMIAIMVEHGLWEAYDSANKVVSVLDLSFAVSFRVHDYLKYNPSKRAVMQLRKNKGEAGRKGGLASGVARAKHSASSLVPVLGTPKPNPNPLPKPETEPSLEASPPLPPSRRRRSGACIYPTDFLEFWETWPETRRIEKADALKAWVDLAPDSALRQVILAAVKARKQSADWQREHGRYIPYPGRWLKKRRWEDAEPPSQSLLLTDKTSGNQAAATAFLRHMGVKGP